MGCPDNASITTSHEDITERALSVDQNNDFKASFNVNQSVNGSVRVNSVKFASPACSQLSTVTPSTRSDSESSTTNTFCKANNVTNVANRVLPVSKNTSTIVSL